MRENLRASGKIEEIDCLITRIRGEVAIILSFGKINASFKPALSRIKKNVRDLMSCNPQGELLERVVKCLNRKHDLLSSNGLGEEEIDFLIKAVEKLEGKGDSTAM